MPDTPFPLTPGAALAVAALIESHPNPLPHWRRWVVALREWAALELSGRTDPEPDEETLP